MADIDRPPNQPIQKGSVVDLYRRDPETKIPIIIGRVYIDIYGDAWVQINSNDLAEGIGVENIDGVALMTRDEFNGQVY